MESIRIIQGRQIGEEEINLIRDLMAAHPEWNRTRLSRELCVRWDWCNAQGRPKDMAAHTLLLKLERAGHLRLPTRCRSSPNARRNKGRQTCERLWTVVGTCAMQGRSAFEFILAAVSAHFRGEPAPSLLPALG